MINAMISADKADKGNILTGTTAPVKAKIALRIAPQVPTLAPNTAKTGPNTAGLRRSNPYKCVPQRLSNSMCRLYTRPYSLTTCPQTA